tara:strand:- start:1597 stop:1944 length:348 start_codon:yes stop_codon:yes gene_type:complete
MNEKTLHKITKKYPNWAKKIRRVIINLYRPILHDKSASKFNQHPIAYLMFAAFCWSAYLVHIDSPDYYLPFLSMFSVIPLSWIYLKIQPQTWDEMYDYEKEAFRQIWRKHPTWKP